MLLKKGCFAITGQENQSIENSAQSGSLKKILKDYFRRLNTCRPKGTNYLVPCFFKEVRKIKERCLSIVLVIEIISISILSSFFVPVGVFALSAGGLQTTVASIILSLFLQTGAAPVNQSFIDTLNTSYGVTSEIGTLQNAVNNGLLTESGGTLIDTGLSSVIESQPAYDILNLDSVFTTYADDGINIASGGVNLTNTAINVGTVGTIGAFAGAASIGIGIGVLANHVREYIGSFVKYGLPLSAENISTIMNNIPDGYSRCYFNQLQYRNEKYSHFYFVDNIASGFYADSGGTKRFYLYNNTSDNTTYQNDYYINSNGPSTQVSTIYPNKDSQVNGSSLDLVATNFKQFNNRDDMRSYFESISNGTLELDPVYSPDIIGKDGNLKDNEIGSVIPSGYDMNPVDMNDYQDYADGARNNTDDGNINQPVQGEEFDNLIDSLLVEPSIIPDQGIDTPDVPDRPIIPDQPETPGKDPITPEQQADVLEGITTPDLRSVFPFCIPFDLFALLGELKDVNREAPVIVWEMPEELGGYSIILDLSVFDEAASLIRLLELALFIVGLAVETRNLIGAKG